MKTDRRNFLIQTASVAGVLGLGYVLKNAPEPSAHPGDAGRPPAEKAPCDLLQAALARMAAEGKPGIAVRIPTDPQDRHSAGHYLVSALNHDSVECHELFAQAVFVCLESAVLQAEIQGADPHDTVILFDGHRRAIAGDFVDFGDYSRLPGEMAEILDGPREERLRARAERAREKADATVLAALQRPFFEETRKVLSEHASGLAPLLVLERRRAAGTRRGELLAELLKTYVLSSNPKTPGVRLPFGVEASPERGGCGDSCDEQPKGPDGQIRLAACGMGRMGPDSRSFVRYLKS